MPPFHDRIHELAVLESAWRQERAVFLTVSGRRRVGKSRLLSQFLQDRAHLYLTGTRQTARRQLADATREAYRVTGDPVLAHQNLDSWDALLAFCGERGRERRFALVLDEFSYYSDATPGLPSIVQRWWDRAAPDSRLFLVIADSHLAFMERLVRGDQPLFGRHTHRLDVHPFDYADAARFFPDYSPEDRVRAYGVFGGMPAYLGACDASRPLADNLHATLLADGSALRHEPDYLFAQERSINDPLAYFAVLRAIAEQKAQPNDIAQGAGFRSPADITVYLQRLQTLDLVERVVPVTAQPGGRISRYIVTDHLLAFWFRFVQPTQTLLEQGLSGLVLDDLQRDSFRLLDEFVSRPQGPWEQACAAYLWRAQRAGILGDLRFDRLGCWWEGRGADESAEIDVVGVRGKRITLFGSCKWRRAFMTLGDLHALRALAPRLGADDQTRYILFSRSGFDPSLEAVAQTEGVRLVRLEDLYQPPVLDA